MLKNSILFATISASLLAGCSSRPRDFAPVLGLAPASAQTYDAEWRACHEQVASTANRRRDQLASAAGGVMAGAGASAAVGAAASGTYATIGGAMAALGATIVAAPIALIGGAWAISKVKKTKKERAIKSALAQCLGERGYSVAGWRVLSKREVRALRSGAGAVGNSPLAAASANTGSGLEQATPEPE